LITIRNEAAIAPENLPERAESGAARRILRRPCPNLAHGVQLTV